MAVLRDRRLRTRHFSRVIFNDFKCDAHRLEQALKTHVAMRLSLCMCRVPAWLRVCLEVYIRPILFREPSITFMVSKGFFRAHVKARGARNTQHKTPTPRRKIPTQISLFGKRDRIEESLFKLRLVSNWPGAALIHLKWGRSRGRLSSSTRIAVSITNIMLKIA